MKILHFILGKANKNRANGVNQVIAGLAKYCVRQGAEVRVIGMAGSVDYQGQVIARDEFSVEAYSKWSLNFHRRVIDSITWADIVHLHGVYSPWNIYLSRLCEKYGCPYIVTLHGGLSPFMNQSPWQFKKRLFHSTFQKRYLSKASAIHVLTEEESSDLLRIIRPNKIILIPNGIDLDDYPFLVTKSEVTRKNIQIGYLGRISPEKNIDSLCEAFKQINIDKSMQMKIAGPSSNHLKKIIKKYSHCGVEWVGPKYGYDKYDFIKSVDIFVHPSLSDVFSIAAMEVLAVGTPLLITRTSNVSYFYNSNSFFMCEPTVYGIKRGVELALKNRDEWPMMCENAHQLINNYLNWNCVAKKMLESYDSLVEKCL